jgi:hypothetical protein
LRTGGRVAFDVATDIEIGDGDEEMRAGVMVHGNDSAGLELELGGTDGIFDEENLFGAVGKDAQTAVFRFLRIPRAGRVA